MKHKITKRNWVMLILGIFLDAMGVSLITQSNFGVSAVSSVAYTLSVVAPVLTFGVWSYLYQFLLFGLMCFLVRKCSLSYILSFLVGVVFGYTLDFCRFLIGAFPLFLEARILYFIAGTALLVIGVSFLMLSEMPIMPQDLFTRELSEHFRLPFKYLKTGFDISCVGISLLLSLCLKGTVTGIGIGTVINAFIIGRSVHAVKFWIADRLT